MEREGVAVDRRPAKYVNVISQSDHVEVTSVVAEVDYVRNVAAVDQHRIDGGIGAAQVQVEHSHVGRVEVVGPQHVRASPSVDVNLLHASDVHDHFDGA